MGQTQLSYSNGRMGSKIILSFGSLFPNQNASTSFAREHDTFSGQFQLAAVGSNCPKLVPSGPRGLGCRMNMVLHHAALDRPVTAVGEVVWVFSKPRSIDLEIGVPKMCGHEAIARVGNATFRTFTVRKVLRSIIELDDEAL